VPIGVNAPDLTFPLVVGFLDATEIRGPRGNWVEYDDIPDRSWTSLDCLIFYNGKLYHVERTVTEVDVLSWVPDVIGVVPDDIGTPQKCAGVDIEGVPGIYVRSGHWFNLDTRMWEAKAALPLPAPNPPNSMWRFGGQPTVFGNARCDALSDCVYDQV
jgi:hypothetical protein